MKTINFAALEEAYLECVKTRDFSILSLALQNQCLVLQVTEDSEIISLVHNDEVSPDGEDVASSYEDPNAEDYDQLVDYIDFIRNVQNLSDSDPDFLQLLGDTNWDVVTEEVPVSETTADNGEFEVEYYDELLSDLVGQTVLSNGSLCLKVFADKYATQCYYHDDFDTVEFYSLTHSFTIHSGLNNDTGDCVFFTVAKTIFTGAKTINSELSFTTQSFDTIEESLDSIKRLLVRNG